MRNIIEFRKPKHENEKLLPCPFCGSDEVVYAKYKTEVGERWLVICTGCIAEIDPGYAQERYTAREKWNRRA